MFGVCVLCLLYVHRNTNKIQLCIVVLKNNVYSNRKHNYPYPKTEEYNNGVLIEIKETLDNRENSINHVGLIYILEMVEQHTLMHALSHVPTAGRGRAAIQSCAHHSCDMHIYDTVYEIIL